MSAGARPTRIERDGAELCLDTLDVDADFWLTCDLEAGHAGDHVEDLSDSRRTARATWTSWPATVLGEVVATAP